MAIQPFIPPGSTLESLHAKPFHIYDMDFLAVIGDSPTLTMIAKTTVDPLFHEAATWWALLAPVGLYHHLTALPRPGTRPRMRCSLARMQAPLPPALA